MARKRLTHRALKALRPASPGTRFEIADSDAPGLAIRLTDKGTKTFVLVARFPGSSNPTRRALGEYGALSLEQARRKAREWQELIRRGIDPRDVERRAKQAEDERREHSFGRVAADFERLVLVGPDPKNPLQRTGLDTAHEIKLEFVSRLGDRPIDSITARDILAVVDAAKARGAPYRAHNLLGHARRLFNWAIARRVYGIDRSPCDRMKSSQVIGPKRPRDRVLTDAELRAVWNAAGRMGYPFGSLIHLLILTGQRRGEIAGGQWSEVDLPGRLWRVPASRMKAGAAHIISAHVGRDAHPRGSTAV
jgi:Arm DNA-binding domain/Phage integrase central domain